MLASLQPVRNNTDVFLDSLSNDLILRGHQDTQHLLIGFTSNIDSAISISQSNFKFVKGALYASNIGIGTITPAANMHLHVSGNARVEGDMIVNGSITSLNTDVKVTDQFTVCNDGTGPALVVTQLGTQPVAEFRDDDKVVFKVFDGGFVTIGSNAAETKLDVEGHATIRGTIFTSNVITSNVTTSSSTSTVSTNLTTITSNLYSSNLIINNQVIINSNGIITNSNFLPPFNTSNVVAGQFTSNFIKDDNITSAKLESNLILKGTTTITSNAFINNGDLKILGTNNFINVGDQARLFLGSNDYFMASSKEVGLVFQVPGTTYPVIIENVSGFMGLGTMDPQENLHVKSNAKIEGSSYVLTKLGVGNSNPEKTVDITGTTQISDTTTLLDDLSIMSNNGAWNSVPGRQLYLRYSTQGVGDTGDAAYIQSIDRSTSTFYNMALEASNIALGKNDSLTNPTLYAQHGGRIGIGTSNPLFNVHVSSNTAGGVVIAIDNSNTTGWTEFSARNTESGASTDNSGMRMGMIGTTFTNTNQYYQSGGFLETDGSNGMSIAATSNSGELRFYTGGTSERIRITSNGLLGIGTSSPTEFLQVIGKAFVDTQVLGTSNDSQSIPSFAFKEDSNTGIFHPSNDAIGFTTAGVEKMRIDNQGFVGIGMSNAEYMLDVVGTIHTSNDSAFIAGNRSGLIRIIASMSNTYIQSGLSNATNSAAPLIFTTINNATEWARFDSNGLLGLGTSNPAYKLDVSGQANVTSSVSDEPSLTLSNNLSPYMQLIGSNTTFTIGASGSNTFHSSDAIVGDVVIKNEQTLATGRLFLQVGNGVSAVTVNSNNFVGIGTSTPINVLDVTGNIRATENINADAKLSFSNNLNVALPSTGVQGGNGDKILLYPGNTSVHPFSIGINTNTLYNSVPENAQYVWYQNGNAWMTLSNAMLGINTSNPTENIQVSGGKIYSDTQILVSSNDTASLPGFSFKENSNTGIFHPSNDAVAITTGGTEKLRVDSLGNVGIGVTPSSYKLDVMSGRLRVTGDGTAGAIRVAPLTSSNASTIAFYTNSNLSGTSAGDYWVVGQNAYSVGAGNLGIGTENVGLIMAFSNNGNVGIGGIESIGGSAKLNVNGDVLANSNIRSSVGTLGPSFTLVPENSYIDVSPGDKAILNSLGEAGNPATGTTRPLFYGSSFLYQDASGEDMKWNFARLIFRGCPLNDNPSTSVMSIQDFVSSRAPQYSNITYNFTLSNDGQESGYVTYGTPWFGVSTSSGRSLAMNLVSNSLSSNFRVGQVQIQFKT
jgi:hypothetical protein